MEDLSSLLAELLRQEQELQFSAFDNELAYRVGCRFVEIGLQTKKTFTVDITRHSQQLFHCALPGTAPDNDEWIKRKSRVVNRFGHSSFYVGNYLKSRNSSLEEKYLVDPREYAAHGGSFPLIIRNVGIVGTVTVSGLPQEEDHNLVVTVLREFLQSA